MKVIACFLVLACVMVAHALKKAHFEANSVRSGWLAPLRVNKTFEIIDGCTPNDFKIIQEPYGILTHTFRKKLPRDSDICIWQLRAPENHIIHVIYISIDLEDERSTNIADADVTKVILYDSTTSENQLFWLAAESERGIHPFAQSLSTGRDMFIDVDYRCHKDFGTQKITIKYEFVDLDKMKEL